MNAQEAIRHMVQESGRSASDISRSIGKNHNYISVVLAQKSDPRTKNLARIAGECGYRLILENEYDSSDRIELYTHEDGIEFFQEQMHELEQRAKKGGGVVSEDDVMAILHDDRAGFFSFADDAEAEARKVRANENRMRRMHDDGYPADERPDSSDS